MRRLTFEKLFGGGSTNGAHMRLAVQRLSAAAAVRCLELVCRLDESTLLLSLVARKGEKEYEESEGGGRL